ncbi:protein seele [Diaphorina citri]|uniref:Protein seele n=1 Tax=Diaphorina citri TaxID=121845 RepID=A0A1S4EKM3_DIACI|nr:protein seele [Diaphorina citri]
MNSILYIFIVFLAFLSNVISQDPQQVKCLVCYSVIDEIQTNITSMKPNLKANVGGYQLDNEGNMHSKQVQYSHSTVYLSELMDNVCNKMEDYVKATDKESGDLVLMPLVLNGVMNPRMAEVDALGQGVRHCELHTCTENVVASLVPFECKYGALVLAECTLENEDLLIDLIQTRIQNLKYKLCHQETEYCRGGAEPEPVHEEL